MAIAPTEAEIQAMLQNVIHPYEEQRKFAEVNADNFLGMLDTLIQSLESNFSREILSALDASRASINSFLGGSAAAIDPVLREYSRLSTINAPEELGSIQRVIDRIFQHFIDNTERVTSRDFTFGTPTANGSNTGDGVIERLTTDEEGFDIEAQHADAKTAKIVIDQNSGAIKNREVFEFRGGSPGKDLLERSGSGLVANIAAVNKQDSILLNPSFDDTDLAGASINGWSSTAAINATNFGVLLESDAAINVFHQPVDDDELPQSLDLKVATTLTQKLTENGIRLDVNNPYYLTLHYNPEIGTALGTLTLGLGSVTEAVVVDGLTGWRTLKIPIGVKNWYHNFEENNLDISIQWAPTTGSGNLAIDDTILVPMINFDNSWYTVIGGRTPWLSQDGELDEFTWTDTEVGSIIQLWLVRAFNRYLPHTTGGGVTITDP